MSLDSGGLLSFARLSAVENAADHDVIGRDPVEDDVLAVHELVRAAL
jgi:hypothetical protein